MSRDIYLAFVTQIENKPTVHFQAQAERVGFMVGQKKRER